MMEKLSVSISGTTFSLLLYENTKCSFAQEGFLLGEMTEKETRTITDAAQQQKNVSRVVKINSLVPSPCFFYDGIGKVDIEKIKNLLGDMTSKVVAWYKYRLSSNFNFTFRERIIHHQLMNLFELPSEFFTCCLLTSESSNDGSTHTFSQNFVRYCNHGYKKLPLHIMNLNDPNNTYKSPERVSETFKNILKDLQIDHNESQGLSIITKIQNALQEHTKKIVEDLSEAEEKLFKLENEIKKIKKKEPLQEITTK